MFFYKAEVWDKLCKLFAVLDAPCEFGFAALDRLFFHMLYHGRIHCFNKNCDVFKAFVYDIKNLLYVLFGEVHSQTLDNDDSRGIMLGYFFAPIVHGGHCYLGYLA